MEDAMSIIQRAANRGACQMDLVKAAAACIRSVMPLASLSTTEVQTALVATERWTANPTGVNAGLALEAVPDLSGIREQNAETVDVSLLLASAMAALAAANADFTTLTAVFAVEFARKAAVGREIDLAPIVTAELL